MLTSVTLTILFYASVRAYKDVLRVYNGIEDVKFQYPYVVSLLRSLPNKEPTCTGTHIASTWVLTAAHCFIDNISYIKFRTMKPVINSTDIERDVIKLITHPRFSPVEGYLNDIGLILISPMIVKKYGRISSVDYKTLSGQTVVYAGYGFNHYQINKNHWKVYKFGYYQPLRYGSAVVGTCQDKFTDNYICLSPDCSYKQLALHGDSGGPLLCDNKIVGVACKISLTEMYQAFTPVSPHLSWIHDVITKEN